VPAPALWYDASRSPLSDGSPVAGLGDLSGFGRDAVASGAGPVPTYDAGAFGGLGAVECQGQADYVLVDPFTLSGGFAVLAVVDRSTGSSFFALNPSQPAGSGAGLCVYSDGETYAASDQLDDFSIDAYSGVGPLLLRWYRSAESVTFAGTGAAPITLLSYLNPAQPACMGPLTVSSFVHRQGSASDGGTDLLAELLVFDAALTGPQQVALESYLTAKWGVDA
jgi:hypothetical protein